MIVYSLQMLRPKGEKGDFEGEDGRGLEGVREVWKGELTANVNERFLDSRLRGNDECLVKVLLTRWTPGQARGEGLGQGEPVRDADVRKRDNRECHMHSGPCKILCTSRGV